MTMATQIPSSSREIFDLIKPLGCESYLIAHDILPACPKILNRRFFLDEEVSFFTDKNNLYRRIRAASESLKGCSLNQTFVGRPGCKPSMRRDLVLISTSSFDQKIIDVVMRSFESLHSHITLGQDSKKKLMLNPQCTSLYWKEGSVRVLFRPQIPLDTPSKKNEATVLPEGKQKAAHLPKSYESLLELDNPDWPDSVHLGIYILAAKLNQVLHNPLPLNKNSTKFFCPHDLLCHLSELHQQVHRHHLALSSFFNGMQAGLYGSKLRFEMGLCNESHDIDIYFKLPLGAYESVIESLHQRMIGFFQRCLGDTCSSVDLTQVLHRSTIYPGKDLKMDVFYLGWGAGLNITYFTPIGDLSSEAASLSNFTCDIEDLSIPFSANFVDLHSTLNTLSGTSLLPLIFQLSERIFTAPNVLTHNALERILDHVTSGWLPSCGTLDPLIMSYFLSNFTDQTKRQIELGLNLLEKGIQKRLHVYRKSPTTEQFDRFYLSMVNMLFISEHVEDSDFKELLQEALFERILQLRPLKELSSVQFCLSLLKKHNIKSKGLPFVFAALFPYARSHELSDYLSLEMTNGHLVLPVVSMDSWERACEAILDFALKSDVQDLETLFSSWQVLSKDPSRARVRKIEDHRIGFNFPAKWAVIFENEEKHILWRSLTESLLPYASFESVELLCDELIDIRQHELANLFRQLNFSEDSKDLNVISKVKSAIAVPLTVSNDESSLGHQFNEAVLSQKEYDPSIFSKILNRLLEKPPSQWISFLCEAEKFAQQNEECFFKISSLIFHKLMKLFREKEIELCETLWKVGTFNKDLQEVWSLWLKSLQRLSGPVCPKDFEQVMKEMENIFSTARDTTSWIDILFSLGHLRKDVKSRLCIVLFNSFFSWSKTFPADKEVSDRSFDEQYIEHIIMFLECITSLKTHGKEVQAALHDIKEYILLRGNGLAISFLNQVEPFKEKAWLRPISRPIIKKLLTEFNSSEEANQTLSTLIKLRENGVVQDYERAEFAPLISDWFTQNNLSFDFLKQTGGRHTGEPYWLALKRFFGVSCLSALVIDGFRKDSLLIVDAAQGLLLEVLNPDIKAHKWKSSDYQLLVLKAPSIAYKNFREIFFKAAFSCSHKNAASLNLLEEFFVNEILDNDSVEFVKNLGGLSNELNYKILLKLLRSKNLLKLKVETRRLLLQELYKLLGKQDSAIALCSLFLEEPSAAFFCLGMAHLEVSTSKIVHLSDQFTRFIRQQSALDDSCEKQELSNCEKEIEEGSRHHLLQGQRLTLDNRLVAHSYNIFHQLVLLKKTPSQDALIQQNVFQALDIWLPYLEFKQAQEFVLKLIVALGKTKQEISQEGLSFLYDLFNFYQNVRSNFSSGFLKNSPIQSPCETFGYDLIAELARLSLDAETNSLERDANVLCLVLKWVNSAIDQGMVFSSIRASEQVNLIVSCLMDFDPVLTERWLESLPRACQLKKDTWYLILNKLIVNPKHNYDFAVYSFLVAYPAFAAEEISYDAFQSLASIYLDLYRKINYSDRDNLQRVIKYVNVLKNVRFAAFKNDLKLSDSHIQVHCQLLNDLFDHVSAALQVGINSFKEDEHDLTVTQIELLEGIVFSVDETCLMQLNAAWTGFEIPKPSKAGSQLGYESKDIILAMLQEKAQKCLKETGLLSHKTLWLERLTKAAELLELKINYLGPLSSSRLQLLDEFCFNHFPQQVSLDHTTERWRIFQRKKLVLEPLSLFFNWLDPRCHKIDSHSLQLLVREYTSFHHLLCENLVDMRRALVQAGLLQNLGSSHDLFKGLSQVCKNFEGAFDQIFHEWFCLFAKKANLDWAEIEQSKELLESEKEKVELAIAKLKQKQMILASTREVVKDVSLKIVDFCPSSACAEEDFEIAKENELAFLEFCASSKKNIEVAQNEFNQAKQDYIEVAQNLRLIKEHRKSYITSVFQSLIQLGQKSLFNRLSHKNS